MLSRFPSAVTAVISIYVTRFSAADHCHLTRAAMISGGSPNTVLPTSTMMEYESYMWLSVLIAENALSLPGHGLQASRD
jgi:hypothetical protein